MCKRLGHVRARRSKYPLLFLLLLLLSTVFLILIRESGHWQLPCDRWVCCFFLTRLSLVPPQGSHGLQLLFIECVCHTLSVVDELNHSGRESVCVFDQLVGRFLAWRRQKRASQVLTLAPIKARPGRQGTRGGVMKEIFIICATRHSPDQSLCTTLALAFKGAGLLNDTFCPRPPAGLSASSD